MQSLRDDSSSVCSSVYPIDHFDLYVLPNLW